MRIAIDASTISTQGGPRTYVLGLLDALLPMDKDNEYVVIYNDATHLGRFPLAKEVAIPGKKPLARLWREHVRLPLLCRDEKVDLLHCPKSAIPLISPHCPVVVTLHDLIPIKHSETEGRLAQLYWRLHIPRAARKSRFVMTDSEHAKNEIISEYAVAEDRIQVVPLGFEPVMSQQQPRREVAQLVRDRHGIGEGYILYVGTIQPRKNLQTLIEAYALLRESIPMPPSMVIVGRKGWLYDDLFVRIRSLGLEEFVLFTGFVPDEDLPAIYAGANVFAYLSLFEGFGLPPLEAMACGIPVVVSNTTSIPEVVGDAGITVEPTDVSAVAEAIREVLVNPSLSITLREQGLKQAARFSWKNTAEEVLKIYRSVGGHGDKT